jgi:hypothetical protein
VDGNISNYVMELNKEAKMEDTKKLGKKESTLS